MPKKNNLGNIFKNMISNSCEKLNIHSSGSSLQQNNPNPNRPTKNIAISTKNHLNNDPHSNCHSNQNDTSKCQSNYEYLTNQLHIHQMLLLAESMYDSTLSISLDSCLTCQTFQQCLSENKILPCFIQFMESLGKNANTMVKCILQINCLMIFLKENFDEKYLNVDKDNIHNINIDNQTWITLDKPQMKHYKNFFDDFYRIFNQFLNDNKGDNQSLISNEMFKKLSEFFEQNKPNSIEESEFENTGGVCSLESFQIFALLYQTLYNEIENEYYEKFLRSNFFVKYELEILTSNINSNSFSLSDILFASTPIASSFLDFMNTEGMKSYVDFLIMFRNYRTFSGQYTDAVAIYDRFFNRSNGSDSLLDVSDNILDEIRQSIEQPIDQFQSKCFDRFAYILLQYFSKTYLKKFLESNIFQEYIQNCDAKLNSVVNNKRIIQNNISTTCSNHNNKNLSLNDLSTCDQQNEILWDRNLKGHLQFTYIDKYGRMNSSFEPEPGTFEKKDVNKLSKLLRKISFSTSEDNVKQDDAWKIAESIINDVCSVTSNQTWNHK